MTRNFVFCSSRDAILRSHLTARHAARDTPPTRGAESDQPDPRTGAAQREELRKEMICNV